MTGDSDNRKRIGQQQQGDDDESAIVKCGTTKGPIAMEFYRHWSPNGYDRAVELFQRGFYDGSHFYRVVPNFLVQFGISYTADGELKEMASRPIGDDPHVDVGGGGGEVPEKDPAPSSTTAFQPGMISFAGSGDNSRTSQLFISYSKASKSSGLGKQKWETPVGRVVEGFDDVVRKFYSYGDIPPFGKGPDQGKIHSGRSYIEDNFPLTDSLQTCTVERRKWKQLQQQQQQEKQKGRMLKEHQDDEKGEKEDRKAVRQGSHDQQHQPNQHHGRKEAHKNKKIAGTHSGGTDGGHSVNESVPKKKGGGGGATLDSAGADTLASSLTVDAKLVVAAAVIAAVIWAWSRPYLKERGKKRRQRRPFDRKNSSKTR